MITVEKFSAILQYKTDGKSHNFVARLAARAKAKEHALLDIDKNLKPEYERLVDAVVELTSKGEPMNAVIATAMKVFKEPEKTAHDHYQALKR